MGCMTAFSIFNLCMFASCRPTLLPFYSTASRISFWSPYERTAATKIYWNYRRTAKLNQFNNIKNQPTYGAKRAEADIFIYFITGTPAASLNASVCKGLPEWFSTYVPRYVATLQLTRRLGRELYRSTIGPEGQPRCPADPDQSESCHGPLWSVWVRNWKCHCRFG